MRPFTNVWILATILSAVVGVACAADAGATTQDGRPFASLNAEAIAQLSPVDQQAYDAWKRASAPPVTTSTYQEETGPNTMDLSSDFSM